MTVHDEASASVNHGFPLTERRLKRLSRVKRFAVRTEPMRRHSYDSGGALLLRSSFGMIPEFYYAGFPRQFRLRKRERSSSYVTDDEDENGRKGHVRKERNYSKTASYSGKHALARFAIAGDRRSGFCCDWSDIHQLCACCSGTKAAASSRGRKV